MQYPAVTLVIHDNQIYVYAPTGLELPIMLIDLDGNQMTGARLEVFPSDDLDPEVQTFVQHMMQLERDGKLDMTPQVMETQSFSV